MKATYIVGVDEVGRGPLAGPVAVGVVCIPVRFNLRSIPGIRDSKQLTERAREDIYKQIRACPSIRYAVVMVKASSIDRHGIQACIRTAMRTALKKLNIHPPQTRVLLDGSLYAPREYTNQTTIIRGDASEPVIGAASIMAKVTRDRYMVRQCIRYPAYGFERHKGYGTAEHGVAIRKHGLCPLHRRSFCRAYM